MNHRYSRKETAKCRPPDLPLRQVAFSYLQHSRPHTQKSGCSRKATQLPAKTDANVHFICESRKFRSARFTYKAHSSETAVWHGVGQFRF